MTDTDTSTDDAAETRGSRKQRQGVVVSDVQDKTIIVAVERRITHPLYQKALMRTKKFHAHDERNEAGVGDTVRIEECRPMSKLKRWRLAEIVQKAK